MPEAWLCECGKFQTGDFCPLCGMYSPQGGPRSKPGSFWRLYGLPENSLATKWYLLLFLVPVALVAFMSARGCDLRR